MNVRALDFGKDYPQICEWARARKFEIPPRSRLPLSGFVAEQDGIKYAAVWLYVSGGMGFFEWLVTNNKSPIRGRKVAIEALIDFVKANAAQAGVEAIFSSLSNENLVKLYESKGFQVTEGKMTNLVMKVNS